ncbi:MAG: malto-oligosyltrehalose trehalohydrolase [Planctomycetaceae bacterium]|nr:malto-oligosyltrehalose trehalohydrolase [Planctomycetales bacterium]MCB9925211.1 malto-oligosyltrehalose trehalohydrolase [Planctomycetaceae bacterium]
MSDLFPAPTDLPQGVFRTGDTKEAEWRVWAPHADSLSLVLWRDGRERVLPMQDAGDGYFICREQKVEDGLRYAYRFPAGVTRPDPASRWQPDGIHAPSAVFFPKSDGFTESWPGVSLRELVIYELHVGTFTTAGTFDAIIPRLEQLVDLGVTAIELLPVAQFPGERNWGYDGVHLFAVQNSYGGPQGLVRLIEAAHRVGLGVILDVVYNHLGPEGNYIGEFGPYYSNCYRTPWGNALNYDGPDSGPVRRFVIDNAVSWVRDFGFDGLRLDAIQTIYDLSAKHLLAELQESVQAVAREQHRPVHVIGETNQNDSRLIQSPERGGYGLDGIWADDLHHSIHALLTGEKDSYYVDFGQAEHIAKIFNDSLAFDGQYSRYRRSRRGNRVDMIDCEKFVVCIQNHDQVGNRALGDRLSTLVSEEQLRLAAALMLVSPFTPLLFMGEEYGETAPFPFFCSYLDASINRAVRRGRLDDIKDSRIRRSGKIPIPAAQETFESAKLNWNWDDNRSRKNLRLLYQELLKARKSWPVLREHLRPTAKIIQSPTPDGPAAKMLQLTYERAEGFVVLANLSASSGQLPTEFSAYAQLLSTSSEVEVVAIDSSMLRPFELRVLTKDTAVR